MINRQEVMDFSREFGLSAHIIEKDYVLYWLLAGITSHPEIRANWVFKGGTCLKKCYFETYRFSEDLDFTIIKNEHLNQEFLIKVFGEIATWVYENSGIEMPNNQMQFEIYKNPRSKLAAEGRISYRGPLQQHEPLPRIRLDITADELVVLPSISREIHHPYSDRLSKSTAIQCYCFEELFAEKIRALGERLRPRDLYDVVHIYRHGELNPDRELVLDTLRKKCDFKEVPIPTMTILADKPEFEELKSEWKNMLGYQLPVLPDFEQFWQELPELFEWLYQAVEKVAPAVIPTMNFPIDEKWRPPVWVQPWNTTVPFEIIRFAASNRLCVDLKYNDTRRLIEPYSLRRSRDGNLLLYAAKHETGDIRAYRADRIQGAEVTRTLFKPRYTIELTMASPISVPTVVQQKIGIDKTKPKFKIPHGSSMRRVSEFGPKYIFRCSLCGKTFTRRAFNATLNPHKDKRGYDCIGRIGILEDTRY